MQLSGSREEGFVAFIGDAQKRRDDEYNNSKQTCLYLFPLVFLADIISPSSLLMLLHSAVHTRKRRKRRRRRSRRQQSLAPWLDRSSSNPWTRGAKDGAAAEGYGSRPEPLEREVGRPSINRCLLYCQGLSLSVHRVSARLSFPRERQHATVVLVTAKCA